MPTFLLHKPETQKSDSFAEWLRQARSFFLIVMRIVSIAVIIFACIFKPIRVDGTSSLPTVRDGDYVFCKWFWNDYNRGDFIRFRAPAPDENLSYIKRIIGLPGETVEIRSGYVFINGKFLNEPYIYRQGYDWYPLIVVPKGQYFVLGDNRPHSRDSREFGCISRERIEGKIFFTLSLRSIFGSAELRVR